MRSDITDIPDEVLVVEAALRSSLSLPKVYVYVEDDTDIVFWRSILNKYENKYSFDISTYIVHSLIKAKRGLTKSEFRGKDYMMNDVKSNKLSLGTHKIVCIDADYDLIVNDHHKYTQKMRDNQYVITTYWHSVESFRCAPQNVKLFYELLTLVSRSNINFDKIFKEVSILIYPLLQRLLISLERGENEYTISACANDIKKLQFDNTGISLVSQKNIKHEIETHEEYIEKHAKIWTKIEKKLSLMGVNAENCYLMIQGHCLEEKIVIPMLEYVVDKERKNKENLIEHCYDCEEEKKIRLRIYKEEICSNRNLKDRIQRMAIESSTIQLGKFMTEHIYKKLDKIYR